MENQLIFRDQSGCFVFDVKMNSWSRFASPDIIKTSGIVEFRLASDLPDFAAMNKSALHEYLLSVDHILQGQAAILSIGRLEFTDSIKVFLLLIPHTGRHKVSTQLIFLPSGHGKVEDGTISKRYKSLMKKHCELPGVRLFGRIKLLFYKDTGMVLTLAPPHKQSRSLAKRLNIWHMLTNADYISTEKVVRPLGQIVGLSSATGLRVQSVEDKLAIRINYRGGKAHAPLRPYILPGDTNAQISAEYKAPCAPLSDFHLSQRSEFFRTQYSTSQIATAIKSVRQEARAAPYFLSEQSIERMMGALSSNFYEDIGWKADPSPPQCADAQLCNVSVDIDQVRSFHGRRCSFVPNNCNFWYVGYHAVYWIHTIRCGGWCERDLISDANILRSNYGRGFLSKQARTYYPIVWPTNSIRAKRFSEP